MRQSIRGYADGLIALAREGGGTSVSELSSELSAIRAVVDGSDDLRRALSDPGIPVAARRGVLNDLFGGQVSDATLRLIGFVLDADRATETVADIEWLAERFEAAVRNLQPIGEHVLGTKAAEERIDGYASAILESVVGERALANLEDELFRFARIVGGSDELYAALTTREYPTAVRRQIVVDLLQGKASPAALSLAAYATQVGRPRDYQDLLESVVARVASESNRRLAEVRSAVDLDEDQQRQLAGALTRAVGHDVEVRVTVDPSVLAGFVATIGDTVVDGSARHQLDLLKERLIMPEAQVTTGQITKEERH